MKEAISVEVNPMKMSEFEQAAWSLKQLGDAEKQTYVGRILTILDVLGFEPDRKQALKDLVKQAIYRSDKYEDADVAREMLLAQFAKKHTELELPKYIQDEMDKYSFDV